MRITLEHRTIKLLPGLTLAIFVPIFCYLVGGSTKAGIILSSLLFAVSVVHLEIRHTKFLNFLWILLFLAMPFATFSLGQIIQNVSLLSVGWRILLNVALFLILQFILLLIFGHIRLSLIAGLAIPLLLMLANAYVLLFRGNALTPSDFLSLRTAANVAAAYDFTPTPTMVYALALMAVVILGISCLPNISLKRNVKTHLRILFAAFICILVVVIGAARATVYVWADEGATYNGYILNFILQIKNVFVTAPDAYSSDYIKLLESDFSTPEQEAPFSDIIVIMDESFADLNVFSNELCTNKKVTPFISSLQENTIHGYLYASVFGGRTANSEYEFLSGNTMAFLPEGSIVYQQYLLDEPYSLVSHLKNIGYRCIAMHPYHANGWMRDTVYPQIGFDETYFLEDFPQKQLIREYVSDQEMFEEIIRIHQQRNDDTPLFLFGVTMQNHGGYTYTGANYEQTITLEGYSHEYPEAEQYLSLIHETDKAVQYLLEYYETIQRNVVILFFGDHLPRIEPSFYEELNGSPLDTLDEQMLKYKVPFFIWANYDIEEQNNLCSSINYLSAYVMDAAGISLPPYHQFLRETERIIPAINAHGYYSTKKQSFVPLEESASGEAVALRTYEFLQYNSIFDSKNRNLFFFDMTNGK